MSKRLRPQTCGGFSGVLPRPTREGHKPRRAAYGKRLSVFNPQIRNLRTTVFFFGDENRMKRFVVSFCVSVLFNGVANITKG